MICLPASHLLLIAAANPEGMVTEWTMSPNQLLWRLGLIAAIMLVNAFFVISEFAMVKVRDSQLQAHVRQGTSGAKLALHIANNVERYLSVTQLGITLMSIAIGAVGEPVVASFIQPALFKVGVTSHALLHTLATILSFSFVTFMQVVIAEQTPKRLAIRWPLTAMLWISAPLHLIYKVLKPFTLLLNFTTNTVLRLIFRINPDADSSSAHSGEELRHIVAESERSKEVTETEKDILLNALALNDLRVRDVMTPRNQVIALDLEEPFADNVKKAILHKHTRYPVVEGHLDHTIGLVHAKDLLEMVEKGQTDLRKAARALPNVPEMMPIDKLLRLFLDKHAHFAIVLDEFGGAVGAVTFDNVMEEIVGDIQDEFDAETPEFVRINDNEFTVDGMLNLYELKDLAGLEIESEEVTTIGGYFTERLGHLPKAGEKITLGEHTITATKVDQRRVLQLHFRRTASASGSEQ